MSCDYPAGCNPPTTITTVGHTPPPITAKELPGTGIDAIVLVAAVVYCLVIGGILLAIDHVTKPPTPKP